MGKRPKARTPFLSIAALALFLAACASTPPPASEPPVAAPVPVPETGTVADESGFATDTARQPTKAEREMVVAANPLAARAGLDILRAGGSAVDAAIAVQLVLTLVEPQSSGIGGGGFMMTFDGRSGEIGAYEGRETAPAAATETDFMGPGGTQLPQSAYRLGGVSTAVPGVLRMLEMAHKQHGKLSWPVLFQPAIQLARNGFEVSARLHKSIADDRYLADFPAARKYFFDDAGRPLAVGTVLKNPALADTLEAIARGGADAFHSGAIARDIAAAVQGDAERPGKMTVADIAGYQAKKRRQLCGPYRTWLICGHPPPTAGGVTTLMALAMLERFDMATIKPNSVQAVHLFAEAMRLANADRLRYVADPDFADVPLAGMLNLDYLARRSLLIDERAAMAQVRAGRFGTRRTELAPAEDTEAPSTTHFNIVDRDGNAVTMTSSVGHAFGSRLLVRGFILNNHATDFAADPRSGSGRSKANRLQGGKRPRSAQAPTFVFDGSGRLVMAVGSPGGTRIIAYVVKTLVAVLDWKMDIQAAISLPNRTVRGDWVELERGTVLENLRGELEAMGHKVRRRSLTSGLQGITIKDGVLTGGADPRREGVALGN